MITPRVSVVIPARDAEATLPAVLHALTGELEARGDAEIIVVDNGSTDRTREIASRAGARLVDQPRPGAAAARNAGWRAARGELIAFLDSDCIPRAEWLTALVAALDRAPAAGGAGGVIAPGEATNLLQRHAARAGYYFDQEQTLQHPFMPYLLIGCSCYRRSVLERLEGLEETLRSGEDADLTWRMQRELGLEPTFAPGAIVEHIHRDSLIGLWRQWARYGYGAVQLEGRYPDRDRPTRRPSRLIRSLAAELGRSLRALGWLARGRADLVDVLSPLLRCFEVAAMRAGRLQARRSLR